MKKVVFVLLFAAIAGLLPTEAAAGCFEDASACFHQAATREGFMSRTLAALDCELDLIECARRKIIGR